MTRPEHRRYSSKGGAVALAALVELKSLPALVALMKRAIQLSNQVEEDEPEQAESNSFQFEPLLVSAGITLVRAGCAPISTHAHTYQQAKTRPSTRALLVRPLRTLISHMPASRRPVVDWRTWQVNASYYVPARPVLHKAGAVEVAAVEVESSKFHVSTESSV